MKLSDLIEYALTDKEPPEGFPASDENLPIMLKWEEISDEIFPPGSGVSLETVERVTEHFTSLELADAQIAFFQKQIEALS